MPVCHNRIITRRNKLTTAAVQSRGIPISLNTDKCSWRGKISSWQSTTNPNLAHYDRWIDKLVGRPWHHVEPSKTASIDAKSRRGRP